MFSISGSHMFVWIIDISKQVVQDSFNLIYYNFLFKMYNYHINDK